MQYVGGGASHPHFLNTYTSTAPPHLHVHQTSTPPHFTHTSSTTLFQTKSTPSSSSTCTSLTTASLTSHHLLQVGAALRKEESQLRELRRMAPHNSAGPGWREDAPWWWRGRARSQSSLHPHLSPPRRGEAEGLAPTQARAPVWEGRGAMQANHDIRAPSPPPPTRPAPPGPRPQLGKCRREWCAMAPLEAPRSWTEGAAAGGEEGEGLALLLILNNC